MAKFTLTNKGAELLSRNLAGEGPLKFTNLKLGSGHFTGDVKTITDMVLSFGSWPITGNSKQADNLTVRLDSYADNSSFVSQQELREKGVYCQLGDDATTEILYSYVSQANYEILIPDKNTKWGKLIKVLAQVNDATNITVNVVTKKDKYDFNSIAEMQAAGYLVLGDRIKLWGYYSLNDGLYHTRVVNDTDDGTGILLNNGLYANIIFENKKIDVSYFGLSNSENLNIETKIENYVNSIQNLNGDPLTIYFPPGEYKLKKGFNFERPVYIVSSGSVVINYTGTSKCFKFGPDGLKLEGNIYLKHKNYGFIDEGIFFFTGGDNSEHGIYFNTFVTNPQLRGVRFKDFGSPTNWAVQYQSDNWNAVIDNFEWLNETKAGKLNVIKAWGDRPAGHTEGVTDNGNTRLHILSNVNIRNGASESGGIAIQANCFNFKSDAIIEGFNKSYIIGLYSTKSIIKGYGETIYPDSTEAFITIGNSGTGLVDQPADGTLNELTIKDLYYNAHNGGNNISKFIKVGNPTVKLVNSSFKDIKISGYNQDNLIELNDLEGQGSNKYGNINCNKSVNIKNTGDNIESWDMVFNDRNYINNPLMNLFPALEVANPLNDARLWDFSQYKTDKTSGGLSLVKLFSNFGNFPGNIYNYINIQNSIAANCTYNNIEVFLGEDLPLEGYLTFSLFASKGDFNNIGLSISLAEEYENGSRFVHSLGSINVNKTGFNLYSATSLIKRRRQAINKPKLFLIIQLPFNFNYSFNIGGLSLTEGTVSQERVKIDKLIESLKSKEYYS